MAITKLNASVDLLNDVDTTTAAPADKEVLAWDSNTSQWEPLENNFVEEAPTSGLVYGRANGTWVEVTGGEGGGGTGGAGSVNLAYDKLTPNGTVATFNLTIGGEAREPLGATNLLVSVNGVIQEPGVAFTTAGSTITFTEVPQTDDVIDFIVELTNGSHWELNGVNLEYAGEGTKVIVDQFQANGDAVFNGSVGVNTVPSLNYNFHVEGKSLFQDNSTRVVIDSSEAVSGYEAKLHPTDEGFENTVNSSSRGFAWSNGTGRLMTLNRYGNVGLGIDPTTGTFGLSAKEQLAEWKTKAKKASWPVVTDGAFEQEPTEDLVAQWIETRASNDKLQVKGSISATGALKGESLNVERATVTETGPDSNGITSQSLISLLPDIETHVPELKTYGGGSTGVNGFKITARKSGDTISLLDFAKSTGNATFFGNVTVGNNLVIKTGGTTGDIYKDGAAGVRYDVNSWVPIKSDGTLGGVKLGVQSQKFTDGWFSGNVTADSFSASTSTYFKSSNLAYSDTTINSALQAEATTKENYKNILRHEDTGLTFYTNSAVTGWQFENINGVKATINKNGNAAFSGSVSDNQGPLMSKRGLISTLSTLRNATMDETQDIRESLRSAIDELVEGFEQEIAAMPAPEPEVSTMPAGDES